MGMLKVLLPNKGDERMNQNFEDISIKGRVAYGINCLENAINHYNYGKEKWQFVLGQLWKFTDIEYLDDWYYQTAEFMPDSILEDEKYNEADFEFIDKAQFYKLYDLYTNANEPVKRMIRMIFDIGSKELYGKIQGHSDSTLKHLKEVMNLCQSENIKLPNGEIYRKYSFEENGGWGESFEGREMSLILN